MTTNKLCDFLLQCFWIYGFTFYRSYHIGPSNFSRIFIGNSNDADVINGRMTKKMALELCRCYLVAFHFDKFFQTVHNVQPYSRVIRGIRRDYQQEGLIDEGQETYQP